MTAINKHTMYRGKVHIQLVVLEGEIAGELWYSE